MIGVGLIFIVGWLCKKFLFTPAKPYGLKYWIKYYVAYYFAKRIKKRWKPTFSFDINTYDLGQLGIFHPPDAWEKDCPRNLLENSKNGDIVDIWGGDKDGNFLLISLCRRVDRQSEVILYLRLANGDVYQLPANPDTIVHHTDGRSFKAAGLTVEIHEPIRRCRVTFSGLLRKGLKQEWPHFDINRDLVDVQFCFTWHPASMYYSFTDSHKESDIADILARCHWTTKDTLINPIFTNFENFENWGHWYGRLTVGEEKEKRLLLRGSKERKFGDFDWDSLQQSVLLKGYTQKGLGLHVEIENTSKNLSNVVNGYVTVPADMKRPVIRGIDWNFEALVNSSSLPLNFNYTIETGVKENPNYNIRGKVETEVGFRLFRGLKWSCESMIAPITFNLDDNNEGYGFLMVTRPYLGSCPIVRPPSILQILDSINEVQRKLIYSFDDILCPNPQMVGGKGASLAHLTRIAKNIDSPQFKVPDGFCLTKFAFENLLKTNKHVESAIKHLEDVAYQRMKGVLQDACNSCVNTISEAEIPAEVKQQVINQINKLMGENSSNKTFAVRSSAIGEDGEELSSAGQNETFLGVKGIDKICKAIVKCWASQFAFRSVEYRRQNGQLVNGEIAVVVQEMVDAESAGVLFSRDPRTGSHSRMILTSNYGLGESVVSALSDPDTIILKRDATDDLQIIQKQIGEKSSKIVISENGGTTDKMNLNEDRSNCSISDEMILKLGEIALHLERRYGNGRDLEWAIVGHDVYILQSRPVTTGAIITDDEVAHEFDTGLRTDYEAYTTANIGEVMPGALTPLMITADRRVHGVCFCKNSFFNPYDRYDPTAPTALLYFYNHVFFDRIQQMSWGMEKEKSIMTKSLELGFYGRVLERDETIASLALIRYPLPGFVGKIMGLVYPVKGMINGKKFLKNAEVRYRNYPVHADGAKSAKEAFQMICQKIFDVQEILNGHIQVTMGSNFWNLLILKLLAGDSSDFTLDHYHDFAMLVGSCNGAESGDVPFSMTELVNKIINSNNFNNLDKISPEEALNHLNEDQSEVGEKFRDFLRRHGHRGIREFEMRSPSWGQNPLSFVQILQSMVKTSDLISQKNKPFSAEEAIKNIKTPLGFFKKKMLAKVLSSCKSGVCYREQAKSMLIKVEDCLRRSFGILAKLMVQEGYLPDEDLICFLTFEEIGTVLNTRSSSLLARAQKRRRVYPSMDAIKFEEFTIGFPPNWDEEPEANNENLSSKLELKAYPVCHGSVKATARVITSLNDAHQIQKGDILITQATDIGWSPYFPLLSGIVTELGGLVSHGAVVAREYGLPCLVAASKATQIFKSGDYVHLDSNNGILRKLS